MFVIELSMLKVSIMLQPVILFCVWKALRSDHVFRMCLAIGITQMAKCSATWGHLKSVIFQGQSFVHLFIKLLCKDCCHILRQSCSCAFTKICVYNIILIKYITSGC